MSKPNEDHLSANYQELSQLGQQEDSTTYLVRDKDSGQFYVKREVGANQILVYKTLMQSPHPYLTQVKEIIETDGDYIVIEEYISGKTLDAIISEKEALDAAETCRCVSDLCDALKHIHQHKIVHSDIKPENIIISTDGVPHLINFRHSRMQIILDGVDASQIKTASYTSPEQMGVAQADPRNDIYSLGVLMNVMLTGKLPVMQTYSDPPLAEIIAKCTNAEAGNRYQNVIQLQQALGPASAPKNTGDVPRNSRIRHPEMDISTSSNGGFAGNVPGFRTQKLWKKIVAVIGYFYLLFFGIRDLVNFSAYGSQAFILVVLSLVFMVVIPFCSLTNIGYFDRRIGFLRKMGGTNAMIFRIVLSIVSFILSGYFLNTLKAFVDTFGGV